MEHHVSSSVGVGGVSWGANLEKRRTRRAWKLGGKRDEVRERIIMVWTPLGKGGPRSRKAAKARRAEEPATRREGKEGKPREASRRLETNGGESQKGSRGSGGVGAWVGVIHIWLITRPACRVGWDGEYSIAYCSIV